VLDTGRIHQPLHLFILFASLYLLFNFSNIDTTEGQIFLLEYHIIYYFGKKRRCLYSIPLPSIKTKEHTTIEFIIMATTTPNAKRTKDDPLHRLHATPTNATKHQRWLVHQKLEKGRRKEISVWGVDERAILQADRLKSNVTPPSVATRRSNNNSNSKLRAASMAVRATDIAAKAGRSKLSYSLPAVRTTTNSVKPAHPSFSSPAKKKQQQVETQKHNQVASSSSHQTRTLCGLNGDIDNDWLGDQLDAILDEPDTESHNYHDENENNDTDDKNGVASTTKTDAAETDAAETDIAETDIAETDIAETDAAETDVAETDVAATAAATAAAENAAETDTAENNAVAENDDNFSMDPPPPVTYISFVVKNEVDTGTVVTVATAGLTLDSKKSIEEEEPLLEEGEEKKVEVKHDDKNNDDKNNYQEVIINDEVVEEDNAILVVNEDIREEPKEKESLSIPTTVSAVVVDATTKGEEEPAVSSLPPAEMTTILTNSKNSEKLMTPVEELMTLNETTDAIEIFEDPKEKEEYSNPDEKHAEVDVIKEATKKTKHRSSVKKNVLGICSVIETKFNDSVLSNQPELVQLYIPPSAILSSCSPSNDSHKSNNGLIILKERPSMLLFSSSFSDDDDDEEEGISDTEDNDSNNKKKSKRKNRLKFWKKRQ